MPSAATPAAALRAALVEATRRAWLELCAEQRSEQFYVFALYTDPDVGYVEPTALGESGLDVAARAYAGPSGDLESARAALRWSPCDSPYHGLGEHHFAAAARLLVDELVPDERLDCCFEALAELDVEGIFGHGPERERIALLVLMGDQSNRSIVEGARRINPPAVLDWLAPQLPFGSDDHALATYGSRGAYQVCGLAIAGRTIAACGSGGELDVFVRDADGSVRQLHASHEFAAHWACALSSDGRTLYLSDGARLLTHAIEERGLGPATLLCELGEQIGEILVAPDDAMLVVWTWAGLHGLEARGAARWRREIVGRPLAWFPGGHTLAYADETLVWLDSGTGAAIGTIVELAPELELEALAFSPSGRELALAHGGGYDDAAPPAICEVHALADEVAPRRHALHHVGKILALCWSPDGTRLAAACSRGDLVVWDASGLELLHTRTRRESLLRVAWLDDAHVVAAGRDVDSGPPLVVFAV